ncbi:MAG: hypothetical protein EXQ91_06215 [Alphaproteobacteria bacterium]|nr:hypothetical protein [Alphaproteobacteria bacterium]
MNKPISHLDQERARLDEALDRLDAVVKSVTANAQKQLGDLRAERDRYATALSATQSDRDKATARLAEIEATNAGLDRALGEVTARIDATIGELKAALQE